MTTIRHLYATVSGRRLFYQEAGVLNSPPVVLLHGFPASSFMFRNLIPELADLYHVIAPGPAGVAGSRTHPQSTSSITRSTHWPV